MIATPPTWFDVRADDPSPWASVRVSIEAIDWLAQQWAAAETRDAMAALWGSFLASEAHFRAQLPNVDLTARGTSWELIKFLHVAAGVDQGITDCTPDLADLPRGARARLYYHGVLMVFLGHAYKTGVPPGTAVRWAVMKALSGAACYAIGPLLAREIRRRGEDHPAAYGAALLELLRRAEHLVPLFGVDEKEIADRAATATRSQTARVLKRRGLGYSQIEDFLEGLPGQGLRALDCVLAYFDQRGGNLTALYSVLNRTHFQGALPRYRVRREPLSPGPRDPGALVEAGHCWSNRTLIVIGYGLAPRLERRVLLHEMAHVATLESPPAHGPAFQRELLRLADLGERWARQEAGAYADAGDAVRLLQIPHQAFDIVELWHKHDAAWRQREYQRRSLAARRGAFGRPILEVRPGSRPVGLVRSGGSRDAGRHRGASGHPGGPLGGP